MTDFGPLWDTIIGVLLTAALVGLGWVLRQVLAVTLAVSSLTLQVGELGKDGAALARRLENLEAWRQSAAASARPPRTTADRTDETPTE